MSRAALVILVCATSFCAASLTSFGPMVLAADPPAVSADLQAIYARTSTATAEAEFTAIAKECSVIIPDTKRSEADKAYASKLFAWALNRRGEVRSESAANLVKEGKLSDAQLLDQQAGKDFATAAKYAPDNWRVHHNLAIAHAMQGKFDEAIEELSMVIQLKDDYPNAFYNRAELYFEKEQFAPAIKDYSRAIELVDNDARYFNGRAHARFMLNSIDEAVADYTQAATLEANNAGYITDLAMRCSRPVVGKPQQSVIVRRSRWTRLMRGRIATSPGSWPLAPIVVIAILTWPSPRLAKPSSCPEIKTIAPWIRWPQPQPQLAILPKPIS